MNYLTSEKYSKLDFLGRFMMILWIAYFAYPQFLTLIIFQSLGIHPAYTVYHWILHIGLVFSCIIAAWKFEQVIIKIGILPLMVFMGYVYFRYLQEAMWILNPIKALRSK